MNRQKTLAIIGVAESDLGRTPGMTALQLQAQAAARALADAGIGKEEIDAVFVADLATPMASMHLAEYLRITPRYSDSTNIGGSSFEAHLQHAALAIAAGRCHTALIAYGSTQRSDRSRKDRAFDPRSIAGQFEAPYGLFPTIGAYALAAQRHMHEYGTTPEQLAEVAVAARQWAARNPVALMRDPIAVDDVLRSPPISSPLHLLDCCLVTDGCGAVVVTAPERARDAAKRPVYVLGMAEGHTHAHIGQMPDLATTGAALTGPRAFAMAGVTPADIDVAEIYDSFTITVVMTLEDLGFCAKGEGGAFVAGGRTAPGGDFPMNTQGGGLSYTHPGMFGIFLIIEAVRQLRGECGERQVPGVRLALAHGTGGVLASQATAILGVD